MRILVYGAGALGSAVGGFLARAGNEVTFLGRAPHINVVDEGELQIEGIWGEHRVTGIRGVTSLDECAAEAFELILVTVKSYDTEAAARDLAGRLNNDSIVLSLQNGYGNYHKLAEHLGDERVYAGRVIIGFQLTAPGKVKVTVFGDKIALGCPFEKNSPAKLNTVVKTFNQAELPAFYTEEIEAYVWAKIIYNCALNPLSAILKVKYGELGESKESIALINQMIDEIFAVTQKADIKLFWDNSETVKKAFWEKMLPPTANHNSSMYQDLSRGKKTEITALNGAVVELGKRFKVAVPLNSTLVSLLKFLEANNLKAV